MESTKEQAIIEHRKMWNWIADEIERRQQLRDIWALKYNYCSKHGGKILNHCFLCEYTHGDCCKCPLEWGSKNSKYMCEDINGFDDKGLWMRCQHAETWQEQATLARQIANLPERDDV